MEDNIRMDIEEIGINRRNWVDSAHDRGEYGIEPPGFISHGVGWLIVIIFVISDSKENSKYIFIGSTITKQMLI